MDVDQDGRLDAVSLHGEANPLPDEVRVFWRKNLGGDPPRFGDGQSLAGVDVAGCTAVAAARDAGRRILLVQHDVYQCLSVFELVSAAGELPRFERRGRVESKSAVLCLGDQAWPCVCDWNGDGCFDLLVGGGYGWPRIVINKGSTQRPSYTEPRWILSNNRPIRLLRSEILGPPYHGHNMGYPYPLFVPWDNDALLNAFRHQRKNHFTVAQIVPTPMACSTPFGIRGRITRNCSISSAARRSCSTPFGIRGRIT